MEDIPEHLDFNNKYEKALAGTEGKKLILRLFVAGNTPRSSTAIMNIRKVCEEQFNGLYELEVIDIYQQPGLARNEQIITVPTLIKYLPAPRRLIIGDLSRTERLIVGLDMVPIDKN